MVSKDAVTCKVLGLWSSHFLETAWRAETYRRWQVAVEARKKLAAAKSPTLKFG